MKNTQMLSPAFPPEKKIYLQAVHVGGVEIDICPLSGGIWFDRFEIKKFDEAHEDLSELLTALPRNPQSPEVLKQRRSPRHPEAIMQQMPYGPKGANNVLTIDKCPVCAGIWLDYQEIRKVRELYPTEKDKQVAMESFIGAAFPQDMASKPAKNSLLYKALMYILNLKM